jgi:hypothetical protein
MKSFEKTGPQENSSLLKGLTVITELRLAGT